MERRTVLLEQLEQRGRVRVADLSDALGVSAATIRRDLRTLEEQGLLVRTYGGASAVASRQYARSGPSSDGNHVEVKARIGRRAAELIHDGETVVIGSGRTALAVAHALTDHRDLTVITNALDVANYLIDREGIDVIVLGGAVRPRMHSLLGHLAEIATRELRADTLVMGVASFDPKHGLTNNYLPEVLTDRALKAMASRVMLVAESRKCAKVDSAFLFPMDEVDVLVTDSELTPACATAIEDLGVTVMRA